MHSFVNEQGVTQFWHPSLVDKDGPVIFNLASTVTYLLNLHAEIAKMQTQRKGRLSQ